MKKIFWPKYELDGGLPRYGLERMRMYFETWGKTEKDIPPIFHVAGTNGKGSTTAFLKFILEANGYGVHRFVSPHIVDWNERIEIGGEIITDEYANVIAQECKEVADSNGLQVSYFEGIFAMAVNAFSQNHADACVVEVGLGGRLDATNAFTRGLVSIMTYISLDHCKTLGDTLELIAIEKAGIIKENCITVINKQEKEAMDVFLEIAEERHNRVYAYGRDFLTTKTKDGFIFEGFGKKIELPMPNLNGEHQIDNAAGAIAALLSQNELAISDNAIKEGLKNAKWIGRLQNMSNSKLKKYLPVNAELIIDGAHNDSGAYSLRKWLLTENNKHAKTNILIVSMLERKDSRLFIENLEKCFDFVLTCSMDNEDKSKSPNRFKKEFIENGWDENKVFAINGNFIEALKHIENIKSDNLRIVISGSLYLMGEVLGFERKETI
ncbi:MAG: bifunctional folylpolyglutamate synthase/dihydrofolate synthase [Rickettsiales bacterium]|nr:bifunctional folylpolyglutamate synthase/dihydrofolate synthase [Rickettsiales bacterium]